MAKIVAKPIEFDAPVDEVFDFMADCENEQAWNPDLRSIRRLTPGPVGPGTEWEGSYRGMGTMRIRLDEYVRPHRLVFLTEGSRMDMRFGFTFTGDQRHTQAAVDGDMTARGAMRLAAPLLGPMMRRTMAQRPAQLRAGLADYRARGSYR